MKLCAPKRDLQYPCIIAVSARVFFGIAVDTPDVAGAGWLAAILGGILVLPLAIFSDIREKHGSISAFPLLWFVPLVYDMACVATGTLYSAEYVALRDRSVFAMRTGLMLAVWCAAWLGGTGLCGAGRIWTKLFPLFVVPVILFQLPGYRLGYLTPIFGKNLPTLWMGALRGAGWYALLFPLWQIHSDCDASAPSVTKCLLISVGVSAGLLLLFGMETPPALFADHTRIFQFDALFANGRFPLTVQLPLIVLWFISLLHCMSIELFAAGHILESVFPRLPHWLFTALPIVLAYIVSALHLAERDGAILAATGQYAFAVILCIATCIFGKKVSA